MTARKSAASFGVGRLKSRSSTRNPDTSWAKVEGEELIEDRLLPIGERRCEIVLAFCATGEGYKI